ncbi:MAG: Ig-like domain-containing protein [Sulfurimonadaceae bacterium]
MKHFFVLLLFITGSISLYGSGDDLSLSKGTDQAVIVQLSPTVAQTDVWNNAKIEVSFTVPLDASSVQKNNIKLTHLSSKTNDHITGTISYSETEKKLTFRPNDLLEPGLYEVEIKSLKAEKAYKDVKIDEIKYRFIVVKEQRPSFSVLSPEDNATLLYSYVTLEVNTSRTAQMTAVNQRLVLEQNRTIKIKGVDNNGTYYLYNLPLLQGSNEINITATSEDNVSLSTLINLASEANGTAPIGMRAGSYEGIGSLQTTVEVGTLLNVGEYLFDSNGDGIIDEIHTAADSNFTVNYIQEGRYKPRVTIRTIEGPLYSSGDFALSLDVKADANQSDPVGAQPINVAKAFVKAVLEDDRESVERLTGNNAKILQMLYGNAYALPLLKTIYTSINTWQVKAWNVDGRASVSYTFDVNGTTHGGGMELKLVNRQINSGRYWIVTFIY